MIPTLFNSGLLGSTSGGGGGGTVGGWVELGRTTLGGTGDTITVSSIADKRYYMILGDLQDTGGNINTLLRFNSDTGTNYAYRYSDDGGTDSTLTSQGDNRIWIAEQSAPIFHVGYAANRSANEKLVINHSVTEQAAGAATAPSRMEFAGKWANTSNAIDTVSMINSKAGSYNTGSEVVVLGWDESDTHTNNFWEELASVNATGSSTNLSSGTITAKKYLWVQMWLDPSASSNHFLTFNNDSGTSYATRDSRDGGSDSTNTSGTKHNLAPAMPDSTPSFHNFFIINNASNEKLQIGHMVFQNTAGASNAPQRVEWVGKWDNTSNQITEIDMDGSSNWNSGSIMKVWGAD